MTTTKKNSTEAWLDELELAKSDMRDGAQLARIGAALDALEAAERDLADAVAEAHAAGDTWAAIGAVLGTSRQAAHRKYAPLANESVPNAVGRNIASGVQGLKNVRAGRGKSKT
ncbi:hypothetical protein GCM10017608_06340 [Agromyces luteolus]|uniref:hypothetical protein n=1 Tax=Agromyces luteolus TaxID=88373 RepID=UPI00197AAAB3|nr:hypothetical protein [Agromyces luteolus]GLK26702.1 hypothetical protein GCM10017608_06340 [Agromyces luteolus]